MIEIALFIALYCTVFIVGAVFIVICVSAGFFLADVICSWIL